MKPQTSMLASAILLILSGSALADCYVPQGQAVTPITDSASNCFVFGTDVQASGTNALAMGVGAHATMAEALAVGNYAYATGNASMALGRIAQAQGDTSTAIGYRSNAIASYSLALGANTTANDSFAIAIGANVISTGQGSISIGSSASGQSDGSIAIGFAAKATDAAAVAIGQDSAAGPTAAAIGPGATATGFNAAAFGNSSQATSDSSLAAGVSAKATNTNAVALGRSSTASGASAVALGGSSSATGGSATALGNGASATKDNAIALGNTAAASAFYAMSLGTSSQAAGLNGVALGYSTYVDAVAQNGVAIGYNSRVVDAPQASYTAYGLTAAQASMGVVSFGSTNNNRILRNVAAGVNDSDAVTVGQLKATRAIVDATATSVAALSASAGLLAADSTYTTKPVTTGKGAIALGAYAAATSDFGVALGMSAEASGRSATAVGTGAYGTGQNTVSIGASAGAEDAYDGATSIGSSAVAAALGATAVGKDSSVTVAHSVALGDGTVASRGAQSYNAFLLSTQASFGELAVGSAGNYRQITGVAAGSEDNDAVNVAQLKVLDGRVSTLESAPSGGALPVAMALPGLTAASASAEGVAFGSAAAAQGNQAVAIGYGAAASNAKSIALGSGSVTSQNLEVSVGDSSKGLVRRLANVADGTSSSDAATLGQLQAVGAVASGADGKAVAAKSAADAASIAAGAATTALNSIASTAVAYDDTNRLGITLGNGSDNVRISHLADGVLATDAATVAQVNAAQNIAAAALTGVSATQGSVDSLSSTVVKYSDTLHNTVAFGDGSVPVRLSQLADGVAFSDAATVGQISAVQTVAVNAQGAASAAQSSVDALRGTVVTYGDAGHKTIALGDGTDAVRIGQVADGIAASDAATVGQVTSVQSIASAAQVSASAAQSSVDALSGSVVTYTDAGHTAVALGNGTDKVRIGQVADGMAATDAATFGQVSSVRDATTVAQQTADAASSSATTANSAIAGLTQIAVQYQDVSKGAISFGDGSKNVRLSRVADGVTATDAVNKGQLDAVAGMVNSGAALGVGYTDASKGSVVLGGASGTTIGNVADGVGANDAVNKGQLERAVAGAAASPLAMGYDAADFATVTLKGPAGTTITNVADGIGDHDASTVGQLHAVDTRATAAIDDVRTMAQGAATGVTELSAAAVTYAAGGRTSVSFGDAGTPVTLSNVADGVTSTDAVSKGQLDRAIASAGASPLAMGYDDASYGVVTLKGASGTRVGNLADGIDAHDASTVGQLHEVDTRLSDAVSGVQTASQATAASVAALGATAIVYDAGARNRVTLGEAGTPVTISNVADGTAPSDAVNRAQLDAVAAQASTGTPLGVAYEDSSRASISLSGTGGTTIRNVAAGVADTDAANVGQVNAVRSGLETAMLSLGGGAGFGFDGAFIPPAYKLQGQTYRTVGDAFAAVDSSLDRNSASVATLDSKLTSSLDGISGSTGANSDALRALASRVDELEKNPSTGTGTGGGVAVGGTETGQPTVVANTNGVAVGGKASAGGQNATAVGGNSFAAGAGDTAIGGGATVNADYSTAVGSNTRVAAIATHSVAVGANASVEKDHSVALGEASSVTAQNAVALGAGSSADRDNTVSVGAAGQERAITNVAAGTQATDAANTAQVEAGTQRAIDTAKTYTDQRFVDLQTGMDRFARTVDDRFRTVDRRMNGTGAMSTAMSQMGTAAAGASGNGRLAAGVGLQGGERAIAVGYATPVGDRVHINFGGAATATQKTVGAGIGVDL